LIQANPVFGIGLDQGAQMVAVGNLVHNMVLGVWLGAGLLGVLGVVILFFSATIAGVVAFRRGLTHRDRQLSIALLSSMLAVLIVGLSSPLLYQRYTWLPSLMLIALRQSIRTAEGQVI
jgi:O-antigen ligase